MALYYIVERIKDGKILDREFPLDVSKSSRKCSGAGALAGKVEADSGGLRLPSGELLVDQGKSWIHEEVDGVIRNSWIVTRCQFEDAWEIEGQGFSSFPDGRPYEGDYRGVDVDMADVIRHVWEYEQRHPTSNLGVTVKGTTGVRRGTDWDFKVDAADAVHVKAKAALKVVADKRKAKSAEIKKKAAPWDARIKQLTKERKPLNDAYQRLIDARKPFMDDYRALTKQRTTRREAYDAAVKAKRPAGEIANLKAQASALDGQIATAKAKVDARKPAIDAAKVPLDAKNAQIKLEQANRAVAVEGLQRQYDALLDQEEPLKKPVEDAKAKLDAVKEKLDEFGGSWKFQWWDTPDCGDEIRAALEEAGWEFIEWSGWNADRTRILKEIRLVKRAGRRQSELKFVEGENITDKVVIESDSGKYANTIVALGAGEGAKALRCTVGVNDDRLRTPFVLEAKHITKKSVLEAAARSELARRSVPLRVAAIEVDASHDFAGKGTFNVGDEILVDCELSWLGRRQLWHRIHEIEWVDEFTAKLFFEE